MQVISDKLNYSFCIYFMTLQSDTSKKIKNTIKLYHVFVGCFTIVNQFVNNSCKRYLVPFAVI